MGNSQGALPVNPQSNDSGFGTMRNMPSAKFGESSSTSSAVSWFGAMDIASLIGGVIVFVLMLLKWLSVPIMATASSYLSSAGIGSASSYTYTMYNMGDVTDTMDSFYQLGQAFSSTFSSSGVNSPFTAVHIVFLIIWIVALILIVGGVLNMFLNRTHSRTLLLVGAAVATLLALTWCIAIAALNSAMASELSSYLGGYSITVFKVTAAPILTIIFGILTAVCCAITKKA